MHTWIALLRGINVGGRNKVPMAELTATFESAGCRAVRTYIQSGNVVFASRSRAPRNLSKRLGDAMDDRFGFTPHILLLTEAELRNAISNNPFAGATSEPKTLHFFFLESVPDSADSDALNKLAGPTERFELIGSVFYLHAPDGISRSKLASGAERQLGTPATARNYNTVRALLAMLDAE